MLPVASDQAPLPATFEQAAIFSLTNIMHNLLTKYLGEFIEKN